MKKLLIIFVLTFFLMLVLFPFAWEFTTSIVPGWHTTIYPPYTLGLIFIGPLIFILILDYWRRSKKTN